MGRWKNDEGPATPEERKALHELLVDYAKKAALGSAPKGLEALVGSIRDSDVRWQVIAWLHRYTTINRGVHANGKVQFFYRKDPLFDPGPCRLNPYYGESAGQPAQGETGGVSSDREFQKKRLKAGLDKFVKDPCKESISEMQSLMEDYLAASQQGRRNGMFVSGGLPGLPKRR